MYIKPHDIKKLPKSLPIKKLIGPSFIILGLGFGSGELILWPYLTSNYGMGIIWAAVVGIGLQFFMNMEIERYALARGESVFVGFARKLKLLPIWFVFSTFVPWIWPGIAASSAKLLGTIFGVEQTTYLTIAILVTTGTILSLGPVLYKTVEFIQKHMTLIAAPTVLLLALLIAEKVHWEALANGLIGNGDGYKFLPTGIPVASFLAALAYAGAGGNLNLSQSFYAREKGYGMGAYAKKIKSLFTSKNDNVSITGSKFEIDSQNITEFKKWWKNINIEHFTVFFLTGAVTMILLGLLSFATTYQHAGTSSGLNFLILESQKIGELLFPLVGTFFLAIAGIMLFNTQLGVFDATSRILAENIILSSNRLEEKSIPKVYYSILWIQILAGIIVLLLGVTEPLQLVIISAVLNAFAMFVHVGLTLWLNLTSLEKEIRPGIFRIAVMTIAFLFYGGFSVYTIITY